MSVVDDYKKAVIESRLLNPYERDGSLDGASEMPEEFLASVTKILTDFDSRSVKREAEYKEKLQEAFTNYQNTVKAMTDLGEEEKKKLLEESETLRSSVLLTG